MKLGEKLLDHYNQFLGDYIGADVYANNDYEIQILGFPNAIKDCLVLTSFGISKHDYHGNCCEVILPVDDFYDECAEIFANSIFYALSNNMSIGRGLLIEGADSIIEGFSEKCGKTALYFTDVYVLPEEFTFVDKCHIYMGFFVSEEESEYIKKYGSEQFEDLLEEKDVDVIEIKRRSIL
ncbi:suppressor of fused domain protein [uncultured Ruminococcus sp.]|uniref:suppressor of fused domain protein n=1 Tax=uncultured Ruminococcus sp. TaxID=165186 RepID=UPI002616C61B|nr:suppressor of fused domain protein [uncultured Ruminococcus sp.]